MLNFFLEPQKNRFADEFIQLDIPRESSVWKLLGVIILEYAKKTEDTQKVLKPMVIALTKYLASQYTRQRHAGGESRIHQITAYIETNCDTVSLRSAAAHFGYHPVYLSRLLPEKMGKTFSELLLSARMQRARLLLDHTDLSIEKIAAMLGYSNSSNFYRAFKGYYGASPRGRQ